jgi:hypothetical protein
VNSVARVPGGVICADSSRTVIFFDGTNLSYTLLASPYLTASRQPLTYTWCKDRSEALIWCAFTDSMDANAYVYRSPGWSPLIT